MAVKVNRGGKYTKTAKGATSQENKKKSKPDETIDLTMSSVVQNNKVYYVLKYADTGQIVKSAPKWRNSESPRKWARKHNFNLITSNDK